MIIYKTTNKVNGKWYIGRDSRNNSSYLGSGILIKKAIKKYGRKSFVKEVLEDLGSGANLDELKKREDDWLKKTGASEDPMSYNISSSGYTGLTSDKLVEMWNNRKFRKKMSAMMRGMRKAADKKSELYRIKMMLKRNEKRFSVYKAHKVKRKIKGFNYEEGEYVGTWQNQSTCAESLGINPSGISACLREAKRQHCGFIFIYED